MCVMLDPQSHGEASKQSPAQLLRVLERGKLIKRRIVVLQHTARR
jgi:hypothetical protein